MRGLLPATALSRLLDPIVMFSDRMRHAPHHPLRFLGLVALVAVSYHPALYGGFVWDDIAIERESVIHAWSGIRDIWLSPHTITREGHYWPLVLHVVLARSQALGRSTPLGYHAVNLALHALNTALVWRLLERAGVPGAWLAAALFAVHPVHVQSVAWVIERKDLLSALFYLLAALAWLRFEASPRARRYLLVLVLYVAALLSKSVAVTFPAAVLAWAWWRRGRVRSVDFGRTVPLFAAGLAVALAELSLLPFHRDGVARILRGRAGAQRGRRTLVLRRQARVACRSRTHLPSERRGRLRPGCVDLDGRGARGAGAALGRATPVGAGSADGRGVLRADALARARIHRFRLHAVFARRRPLPVPRKRGPPRRRRRGCHATGDVSLALRTPRPPNRRLPVRGPRPLHPRRSHVVRVAKLPRPGDLLFACRGSATRPRATQCSISARHSTRRGVSRKAST